MKIKIAKIIYRHIRNPPLGLLSKYDWKIMKSPSLSLVNTVKFDLFPFLYLLKIPELLKIGPLSSWTLKLSLHNQISWIKILCFSWQNYSVMFHLPSTYVTHIGTQAHLGKGVQNPLPTVISPCVFSSSDFSDSDSHDRIILESSQVEVIHPLTF